MTREQKEKIADLTTSWYTIIPEDKYTNGEIMVAISVLIGNVLCDLDDEDAADEAIFEILNDAKKCYRIIKEKRNNDTN